MYYSKRRAVLNTQLRLKRQALYNIKVFKDHLFEIAFLKYILK